MEKENFITYTFCKQMKKNLSKPFFLKVFFKQIIVIRQKANDDINTEANH